MQLVALNASASEKRLLTDSMTDASVKGLISDLLAVSNDSVDIVQLSKLMSQDITGVENYLSSSVADIDLGESANLNFSQFLILMVKKLGVDGVQKAFMSQDADGSGSVSRNELKEWMTKYGHFLTRKQVQAVIDAVDENEDGEVQYDEFLVSY